MHPNGILIPNSFTNPITALCDSVPDLLTGCINMYTMSLLTALILFVLGGSVAYSMVKFKDRENGE
jgi:preprotein translocase subunit SecF